MNSALAASAFRGVPLAAAQRRLEQIATIARRSSGQESICRDWPPSRFAEIKRLATDLLEDPPADLAAMAMDLLYSLRVALRSDMNRLSNLLEEMYDKPDWRLAYLCYFVPFSLAVLGEVWDFERNRLREAVRP
jgi:hypothetical protein